MGNCLRHQSSMQWAGDDWDSLANNHRSEKAIKMEEEGLLRGGKLGFIKSSSTVTAASTTEIKIKITRKQLKELLGKVDVKELSVEQVLAQLMDVSGRYQETNQRSWQPALQSIPEVN